MIAITLATTATWVLIGGGLVTIIGAVVRGIVHPVVKYARRMERSLSWVEAQTRPNGGTSLRDAIDKLVERTNRLEAAIEGDHHP